MQIIDDPYGKGGFASIGAGIGRGLSEQIPKELQHQRLSRGLQQFSQNSQGLTPMQQMAQLSSIPGISTQMIQSLGNLARQQSYNQSLQNYAAGLPNPDQGMAQGQPQSPMQGQEQSRFRGDFDPRVPQASNAIRNVPGIGQGNYMSPTPEGRGITDFNPLRKEAMPPFRFSPEQRLMEQAKFARRFPGANQQDLEKMVDDMEDRYMSMSETERAQDQYLKGVQAEADNEFNDQLEKKLQKAGEQTFKDLSGELQTNLRKGMERELRDNPNMSIRKAADKWTNKGLELARTKNELRDLSSRSVLKNILPGEQEKTSNALKNYGKIFKDANSSQDYYNSLISDFNLSPRYAAYYAYPLSDSVNKYISNVGGTKDFSPQKLSQFNRNISKQIVDKISSDDSILSIIANAEDKIFGFNSSDFLKYLQDNQDEIRLNDRQKRELGIREDLTPNWSDVFILPWKRGKL